MNNTHTQRTSFESLLAPLIPWKVNRSINSVSDTPYFLREKRSRSISTLLSPREARVWPAPPPGCRVLKGRLLCHSTVLVSPRARSRFSAQAPNQAPRARDGTPDCKKRNVSLVWAISQWNVVIGKGPYQFWKPRPRACARPGRPPD